MRSSPLSEGMLQGEAASGESKFKVLPVKELQVLGRADHVSFWDVVRDSSMPEIWRGDVDVAAHLCDRL